MSPPVTLAQLDKRIGDIRENLIDIVEQATGRSGASDESHAEAMIAAQEAQLARLKEERRILAG